MTEKRYYWLDELLQERMGKTAESHALLEAMLGPEIHAWRRWLIENGVIPQSEVGQTAGARAGTPNQLEGKKPNEPYFPPESTPEQEMMELIFWLMENGALVQAKDGKKYVRLSGIRLEHEEKQLWRISLRLLENNTPAELLILFWDMEKGEWRNFRTHDGNGKILMKWDSDEKLVQEVFFAAQHGNLAEFRSNARS